MATKKKKAAKKPAKKSAAKKTAKKAPAKKAAPKKAAVKAKAIELTPLGRLAEPDDIASVACFLASDRSKFVTGEVVEVNGGFYFD